MGNPEYTVEGVRFNLIRLDRTHQLFNHFSGMIDYNIHMTSPGHFENKGARDPDQQLAALVMLDAKPPADSGAWQTLHEQLVHAFAAKFPDSKGILSTVWPGDTVAYVFSIEGRKDAFEYLKEKLEGTPAAPAPSFRP